MSVIYSNPPLIEAVCEFRFMPGPQPWGWITPGLMYDRVKNDFPIVQDQPALQMQMALPTEQPTATQLTGGISRVQFLRADGTAVVQVGPNALVVNHLRPYRNWDQFRTLIINQFDIYMEITEPLALAQVQLRYINKLELPQPDAGEALDVNKYCTVLPGIPDALNGWVNGFLQRIEIAVPGSNSLLVVQSGSVEAEQANHLGVLVDLEYTVNTGQAIALQAAPEYIEEAHAEIERAFNHCFTPMAKKLFGGEQHG